MTKLEQALYDIGQKGNWNGHDVGKALILTTLCEYDKESLSDNAMNRDFYDSMVDSLSPEDLKIFYTYSQICQGIWYARKEALGKYHNLFALGDESYLNNLIHTIDYCCQIFDIQQTPYIMTPDEYAKICNKTMDFCQAKHETIFGLTFSILYDLFKNPERRFNRYEESVEDIVSAIKALQSQKPTDNPLFLEDFLREYGDGYYILEDGTRSDKVSLKEWIKAVEEDFLKRHIDTINGEKVGFEETFKINKELIDDENHRIVYLGEDYLKDLYQERRNLTFTKDALKKRYVEFAKYLYNGASTFVMDDILDNEKPSFTPLTRELTDFLDDIGESSAEWHYYNADELPELPSKFDILSHIVLLEATRENLLPGEKIKLMSILRKNFPDVAKAVDAYIKKVMPKAKEIKGNQINKSFCTYAELVKAGISIYIDKVSPSDESIAEYLRSVVSTATESDIDYLKRAKIESSGIAITEGRAGEIKLAKDGRKDNFIEDALNLNAKYSPDELINSAKKAREIGITPSIVSASDNMKNSLRFIYSFNAFIEVLSDWLDFPELMTACIDTEYYENRLLVINNLTFFIPCLMYGNLTRKNQRIADLRTLYYPIDEEELKPSTEKKESFTNMINRIGFQRSIYFSRCEEFIEKYLI